MPKLAHVVAGRCNATRLSFALAGVLSGNGDGVSNALPQISEFAAIAVKPRGLDGKQVAAMDLPVTSCADDGSPNTLRGVYGRATNGDVVDLTTLTCSTITLTMGALVHSAAADNVTVIGSGQTIDGNNADRVFEHASNNHGFLIFGNLHVTRGSHADAGGCIYSQGGVKLYGTTVSNCYVASAGTTRAYGGAISARYGVYVMNGSTVSHSTVGSASGPVAGGGIWGRGVTVSKSTVSYNTAYGNSQNIALGGGIFADRSISSAIYPVTIDQSTIAHNFAEEGGGVFTTRMDITHSTIAYNGASSYGGGLFLRGTIGGKSRLRETTISHNNSTYYGGGGLFIGRGNTVAIAGSTITQNYSNNAPGAGIYTSADSLVLNSTIIAGNLVVHPVRSNDDIFGFCPQNVCFTQITGANNLVGTGVNAPLQIPADTIVTNDPMLDSLRNNGASTLTHALLRGSPAIDHGNNADGSTTDQRGFPRIQGSAADIGAFETQDTIFLDGFD